VYISQHQSDEASQSASQRRGKVQESSREKTITVFKNAHSLLRVRSRHATACKKKSKKYMPKAEQESAITGATMRLT
jgi:hypothetical protein